MLAGEDKYVVFVSGLSVGSSTSNPLQFQLLVDHITGHLGDEKVLTVSCCLFFQAVKLLITWQTVLSCLLRRIINWAGTRYCSTDSSCCNCWEFCCSSTWTSEWTGNTTVYCNRLLHGSASPQFSFSMSLWFLSEALYGNIYFIFRFF